MLPRLTLWWMTIHTLRGKTASLRRSWRGLPRPHFPALSHPKVGRTPSFGIGDTDAHVFNCPVCARPLPDGTLRCPGCSTHLVFGVTLKRAGGLLAFGVALGVLVGGLAMSVAIGLKLPSFAATGTVTPASSANTGTSPNTSVTPGTTPATAGSKESLAAMRQMALLDQRMATDGVALQAAVTANRPVSIAQALRALGTDADVGAKYIESLRKWPDAVGLSASRDSFYSAVTSTSRAGLTKSITNKKAYKSSGKSMLTVLRRIPKLDAAARKLAVGAGVELPVVDVSGIH